MLSFLSLMGVKMDSIKSTLDSRNNDIVRYKQSMSLNNDPDMVDKTADWLVEEFDSLDSRPFYCKVAINLPRPTIDRLAVEAKEKGKNPGGLFNYLARKEMNR